MIADLGSRDIIHPGPSGGSSSSESREQEISGSYKPSAPIGDQDSNFSGSKTEKQGPTEAEKYWAILEKNPDDFAKWEYLLKLLESVHNGVHSKFTEEDRANLRRAYDAILKKYPLCFGYWNKYAEHENALSGPAKAEEIYENGLKAIPNSGYLWEHYIKFKINTCSNQDIIRGLFSRASELVGYDFLNAHTFWDKYLEFETSKNNYANVLKIFERIIRIPMHQYARFFESYTSFSLTRPVEELASPEVLEKIKSDIEKETTDGTTIQKTSEEIQSEIRKAIYNMNSEIYMKTQAEVHKRWVYESEIKRTYFHVNPLDEAQLSAWRRYLAFEEAENDHHRIRILYKRCLVVCALYEEFWLSYAKYLMRSNDFEGLKECVSTAYDTFISTSKPALKLLYALSEEAQNKVDSARQIYEKLSAQNPPNIDVVLSYVHFERRAANTEKAMQIMDKAIENLDSKCKGFMEIQKIDLYQHNNRPENLLDSYKDICEEYPECAYSHIKYFLQSLECKDNTNAPKQAWELIKENPNLPAKVKRDIAQRYKNFLMENVSSASEILAVETWVPTEVEPQSKKRKTSEGSIPRSTKAPKVGSHTMAQHSQPASGLSRTGTYNGTYTGYNPVPSTYGMFYGYRFQGENTPANYTVSPPTQTTHTSQPSSWGDYQR